VEYRIVSDTILYSTYQRSPSKDTAKDKDKLSIPEKIR